MNINFHEYGNGTPLVLLHGWGFDHQVWLPIIPELKSRYRIYCIDLPGFGKTPWMPWPLFQSQLLSCLPEKFAVAGWSLGGLYATRLAMEQKNSITHLINICSSPRFLEKEGWAGIPSQVLNNFYIKLNENPMEVLRDFQKLQKYSPIPQPGESPSGEGLKSGLEMLETWDLRKELHDLTLPVCYMFGRLDAIIPFSTLQGMQNHYPHFHYVTFRKSAHMPFLSEKSLFLDAMEHVLS